MLNFLGQDMWKIIVDTSTCAHSYKENNVVSEGKVLQLFK